MNLYEYASNRPTCFSDHLGLEPQESKPAADSLHLTFSSDNLVLGECGEFTWDIHWIVSPAAGSTGGVVLQEMRISSVDESGNDLLGGDGNHHYYEAWMVRPSTTSVGIQEPDDWLDYSIDTWSLGKNEGTAGTATWEGLAWYVSPVAPGDVFSQMDDFVHSALTLPSSLKKPSFKGSERSHSVHRKLKVSWCCKPGARPEDRETKIVDTIPRSYRLDQQPFDKGKDMDDLPK